MGNLVMLSAPNSPAAEAYRTLRTNLTFAALEAPLRTLLIAAADVGDAAGVTANLAVALANIEKRVIALDANLRQPALHTSFGIPNESGLSEWLADPSSAPALVKGPVEGLHVLPTGKRALAAADALASPRMSAALDRLKEMADVVLMLAPPVAAFADAAVLSTHVDGAVLVVVAGKTRRAHVEQAKSLLQRAQARLLGAVLIQP
ncbi:MAG: CpsD/CapB family tyrosine-protein kinase [Anaerolineae bacterium]|nr:CpsD/CapB family tyrosine-protein kinase [Thermoflexales bacterium]MDW8395101.1 CpsD/CapB family tyrosine-protein kinase [Anaerolineae bacterium]